MSCWWSLAAVGNRGWMLIERRIRVGDISELPFGLLSSSPLASSPPVILNVTPLIITHKFSHTDNCKKVKTRQLENLRASSISFYIRIWRLVEKDTSILYLCWICECHLSACFFYMSCFWVKPLNAWVCCVVPLSMFPLKRTIAAINCQELAQLYFSLCKETTTKTRPTLHVQSNNK